ncbi:hypothetical protein ACFL5H_01180 [Candidatus Latescibacterota bacterium]
MTARILATASGIWILTALVAIANGVFRNSFITPRLGEQAGHVISTVVLVLISSAIIYGYVSRIIWPCPMKSLVTIGIFWLLLTVGFEFIFGHYIAGHPWERLLADYNIFRGRIWVFVLIAQVAAPVIS